MKKYNRSEIMKRAWKIYRKHNHEMSWSDSLTESWNIAKNGVKRVTFEHVYSKYYSMVLNYIVSRISDRETAEEITSDIFLRINNYLNSNKYDVEKASFKTLLFKIVKNAIIDHWRKKKMDVVHTDGYVNSEGIPTFDFISNDADNVERAELHEEVMMALNKLKKSERGVVKMFYLDGYKQNEISETLGLSIANVKQIIFRTKDKLQVLLENAYSLMG